MVDLSNLFNSTCFSNVWLFYQVFSIFYHSLYCNFLYWCKEWAKLSQKL